MLISGQFPLTFAFRAWEFNNTGLVINFTQACLLLLKDQVSQRDGSCSGTHGIGPSGPQHAICKPHPDLNTERRGSGLSPNTNSSRPHLT